MSEHFRKSADRWHMFEEYCGRLNASMFTLSAIFADDNSMPVEEREQRVTKLRDCARDVADIDAQARVQRNMSRKLASFASDVAQDVPGRTIETFKQAYEQAQKDIANYREKHAPENNELKKISAIVNGFSGENDDEVLVNEGLSLQAASLCPILKTELTNPVINTKCGHSYSLKGVITFLCQSNGFSSNLPSTLHDVPSDFSVRCPATGCTKTIQPDCLRKDYAAEQTQRQLLSSRRQSIEVEDLV